MPNLEKYLMLGFLIRKVKIETFTLFFCIVIFVNIQYVVKQLGKERQFKKQRKAILK